MSNIIPFKMYTIGEVYNELPKEIRPTSVAKFEEIIEKHGLYREIAQGKRFMVEDDVEALFEIVRSRPREADLRSGPARLLANTPSPNELGYLVVLGDSIDIEAAVFIGWAPRDATGMSDLKRLIQLGYPGPIELLSFCAGTPAEVEEVKQKLARSSIGDGGWFARSPRVIDFLVALRTQASGGVGDDEDDDTEDAAKVLNIGGTNT